MYGLLSSDDLTLSNALRNFVGSPASEISGHPSLTASAAGRVTDQSERFGLSTRGPPLMPGCRFSRASSDVANVANSLSVIMQSGIHSGVPFQRDSRHTCR